MNPNRWQALYDKTMKLLFGKTRADGLLYKLALYALLIIIGFVFLYPIFYMISTSFKNLDDLLDAAVIWIPRQWFAENYQVAAQVMGLPSQASEWLTFNTLYKTLIVIGLPALTATLSTCLIGYGFARFNFPLKRFWLVCIVVGFIIPSQIIMLPQFVWFNNTLNILGTLWSYILPALGGQGLNAAVFILIFYAFFSMIPKSLDEAAYIDGANEIKVFWFVGVRLSFQPILIVFLFNFVWYWNDFYRAAYFLSGSQWTTMPLQLARFENRFATLAEAAEVQIRNLNEPLIMAGTILAVLPLLILYFILQRVFVESIDRTGLTGE